MLYFFFIHFYQNNVRSHLYDTLKWDDKFKLTANQSAPFAGSLHNDGSDTSGADIKFQIVDPSQNFAVTTVDYFFTSQFFNPHMNTIFYL